MIYTDIYDDIIAELNRNDISSRVSAWVDRAYRDVMSRHNFTWMKATDTQPTVVGTYKYLLPDDFYDTEITSLIDGTNSREMKELLYNEFAAKHPAPSSDAYDRPVECSVVHGLSTADVPYVELHVWPPPDGVYTLQLYYTITAPILSGVLSPIIPSKYHSVLVFGGLKYGFARLREYDAATYWGNEMDRMLAAMIKEDRELPNVARKLAEFKPSRTYGSNDYLSPFVRRMP